MKGRLIYLMGPSGSGKDSVLRAVCRMPGSRCRVAHRYITRRPGEVGQESFDHELNIDPEGFNALGETRKFAMQWRANGLDYGIPAEIDDWMAQGDDVLVNGSRAYYAQARERYPDSLAVLLSVSPQELRKRLLARGRDSQADIEARLARNDEFAEFADSHDFPCARESFLRLDNSGPVEETARRLLAFLERSSTCG